MAPARDPVLVNRLVLEHVPQALRFATRLTGRTDVAEEVVQEALYRAARSLHTFRGESQFRTWLFRIVIHAFRDRLKASATAHRHQELTEDVPDCVTPDPTAAVLAEELRAAVAQRVSALPRRQREVLVLVAYEGMSVRQTAELLGISQSCVHVNLYHARKRLKAELGPYLAEK